MGPMDMLSAQTGLLDTNINVNICSIASSDSENAEQRLHSMGYAHLEAMYDAAASRSESDLDLWYQCVN